VTLKGEPCDGSDEEAAEDDTGLDKKRTAIAVLFLSLSY